MMGYSGKADYVIQEGGCGLFQILVVIFVKVIPEMGTSFSNSFMAFGNYNPGWRCLDHNDTHNLMEGNTTQDIYMINSSESSSEGSCELFETCQNIEFDPESSTIVTEWGLLCDKSWVPSLIISVQMAGTLAGSLVAGQLGDTFGRKKTFYIPLALAGILNIVAIFSTYWFAYIVIRFIIGVMLACLANLLSTYSSEFMPSKWRATAVGIPSWQTGGLVLGVSAMLSKDWKTIQVTNGLYFIIACISALWVPESLRWLEVKNKHRKFNLAAEKIIGVNKATVSLESVSLSCVSKNDQSRGGLKDRRVYTVLDLFRKGYRVNTCIIGFLWWSVVFIMNGIVFSTKAMVGNFYLNLIVLFVGDIPFSVLPMTLPNIIGRTKSVTVFMSVAAVCLFAATACGLWVPGDFGNTGSVIFVALAKLFIAATIRCTIMLTTEVYPTVVRSIAMGFGGLSCQIGAVMAPILIPNDSRDLYVRYGLIGTLSLFCSLLVIKLPETKGMKIKEVFEEDEAVADGGKDQVLS